MCERERESVVGKGQPKLKNTLLFVSATRDFGVCAAKGLPSSFLPPCTATSRPVAWWVSPLPLPFILEPSHMPGCARVCLNSWPRCGKTRQTHSAGLPSTATHPPTYIQQTRGYCSRFKPTASTSSGTTPTASPSSQALAAQGLVTAAVRAVVMFAWTPETRDWGGTRQLSIDPLPLPQRHPRRLPTAKHLSSTTPSPSFTITQRQDGPTTGGAGPGGRGMCLGLCAHAPPFHRRAT